ncbi:ribosomal protection-like ABC-F family protein [Paenibacillus nasutitermitis]|uniref:ABC transporter n=1 Tax=Paenibacillus nasutitermitis TaxID=1652958 RepID=A0A916ZBP9_9BACL|nr:ABC-F family ATP-binding cassette domain-containing protein [Paenibacillus nasutitermitis]GGD84324.1 ABC transporter [Paenibacillus nasutitermitis]
MHILKASGLKHEYGGEPLFEDIDMEIRTGERVALFGTNGIGKTTLLQGLLGRIQLTHGSIQRMIPLADWGSLDQQVEEGGELSVLEFVKHGSVELYQLSSKLKELQTRLSTAAAESAGVMEDYSQAYDRFMQLDGYGWEVRVEKCLQQLKLEPALWPQPFRQLSGGQKTRAQLAALMVREPEFIVLDEPTNHLDAQMLNWLEEWVCAYPGTVLYVSHDRTFIDRTATVVMELSRHDCRRYPGGYKDYCGQKELERRTQETLYARQEQEKEKLLESIRRYSQWFQQSHKAAGQNDFYRSKAKKNVSRMHAKGSALEKLERERVQKPRDAARLNMRLEDEGFAASTLLRMEQAAFAYSGKPALLRDFGLTVNRGDRLAILGPNGAGKSTLLKLAGGLLSPISGSVQLHPQTRIGYFAQELGNLDEEETLLGSLLSLPEMTESQARTILGCFMFKRDEVFRKIADLSMGEKCRVAFLKLYFGRFNLLVLDEPTNYLDIDTRERVEEALQQYPGALLLVTHDRYLIRRTANRLIVLDKKEPPQLFPGTYEEYEARGRSRPLDAVEQEQANECGKLELRLARLMQEAEPETDLQKQVLLQEMKGLQQQIAQLKGRQDLVKRTHPL